MVLTILSMSEMVRVGRRAYPQDLWIRAALMVPEITARAQILDMKGCRPNQIAPFVQ